jgi:type IV pilus assembly protein PilC
MLLSAQLSLSSLIELCRALRHNLGAGLAPRRIFKQQAERGPAAVRPVAKRIGECLDVGENLAGALQQQGRAFPPLLVALAEVGEETGHLPEVFGELEEYYRLQQKLRRGIMSRSMGPIIQLALGIVVITVTLLILGILGESRGTVPGGVRGPGAALTFLAGVAGAVILGVAGYLAVTRLLHQGPAVQVLLLRVPVVGGCLEALALGRLAMAMQLTLDSGMPIERALRLSLQATGNAAYAARADKVAKSLIAGEDLATALSEAKIFPLQFLAMLTVGEEGGRIPEMMRHQAAYYREEAERRLQRLARVATAAVWLLYAGFAIVAIFRLASMYLGALGV